MPTGWLRLGRRVVLLKIQCRVKISTINIIRTMVSMCVWKGGGTVSVLLSQFSLGCLGLFKFSKFITDLVLFRIALLMEIFKTYTI